MPVWPILNAGERDPELGRHANRCCWFLCRRDLQRAWSRIALIAVLQFLSNESLVCASVRRFVGSSVVVWCLMVMHGQHYHPRQLFNGTPYLDYGTDPPSLVHPSLSLGAPHNVVAVFRETVLPSVPHRYASASGDASAAGSPGLSGGRATVVTGTVSDGTVPGSPWSPTFSDAAEEKAREKEMAQTRKAVEIVEILAGLGMAQAVHHRDVSGEARGATMVSGRWCTYLAVVLGLYSTVVHCSLLLVLIM